MPGALLAGGSGSRGPSRTRRSAVRRPRTCRHRCSDAHRRLWRLGFDGRADGEPLAAPGTAEAVHDIADLPGAQERLAEPCEHHADGVRPRPGWIAQLRGERRHGDADRYRRNAHLELCQPRDRHGDDYGDVGRSDRFGDGGQAPRRIGCLQLDPDQRSFNRGRQLGGRGRELRERRRRDARLPRRQRADIRRGLQRGQSDRRDDVDQCDDGRLQRDGDERGHRHRHPSGHHRLGHARQDLHDLQEQGRRRWC